MLSRSQGDLRQKARLLLHRKRYFDDGGVTELKLWLLPGSPVAGSAHRFKYSLFYGYPGRRVIAYDNERGKGDHRHRNAAEEPYTFQGLDKLLADFEADVAAIRAEEANSE